MIESWRASFCCGMSVCQRLNDEEQNVAAETPAAAEKLCTNVSLSKQEAVVFRYLVLLLLLSSGHCVCGGRRKLHWVPEPGGLHQGKVALPGNTVYWLFAIISTLQHNKHNDTTVCVCLQFKQGRKVLYGCSELFNSAQFIKQVRHHHHHHHHQVDEVTPGLMLHLHPVSAALPAGPEVMATNPMKTSLSLSLSIFYWTKWNPCKWTWFRLHSTNKAQILDSQQLHSFFVVKSGRSDGHATVTGFTAVQT